MKEVTCQCGWQTRGTEDEVVAAVQEHGRTAHGVKTTREQVLAVMKDVKKDVE